MEQLSDNIWLLKPAGTGVMVSFRSTANGKIHPEKGKLNTVTLEDGSTAKIMYWGARNTLPQEREALIGENNIIPELLGTKRDIYVAGGLYCYVEQIVDGVIKKIPVDTPPEIQSFFDDIDVEAYVRGACKSLITHGNIFTEYVGELGGRITSMKNIECRHARCGEQDEDGVINDYFICGKWEDTRAKNVTIKKVPAYKKDQVQPKFMVHSGDDLFHNDYYFTPRWWGGKDWISLSNRVPIFHNRNLDNGYLIRWHIEIPLDYFKNTSSAAQTPEDVDKSKKAETLARENFIKKLNSFLAAEDGAGRAVVTSYELNRQLGKDFPGIKITPFQVDIKDEALLKLFDKSNDANISSQGIPPALASIQTPGRLGSGSETRNSFNLFLAIKAPVPRSIIVKFFDIPRKRNGWDPRIKIGFRDIELTTLDESPVGQQPVTI
jgi:hypothetical protein